MSSKAFEAALKAPDTRSSNAQLHALITAADFSGSSLPQVAEGFLLAFCDPTNSHIRRRWVGLAFAGMLSASSQVVKHVTAMTQKLHGLGEVIIGTDEREETRIVAGLIIREALAQRFDLASFWSSDKVRNSAPIFPSDFDLKWMNKFQGFMDNLGALALANPVTDPCILYAISLEDSSSFRWAHSEGAMLVSIIQSDTLTIIMPGDLPHAVQFLDIPVSHIQTTNSRASAPLADSQARTTEHEPWDLILKLKNGPWTHLVNSAKTKANQITILFENAGEARECEAALQELQGATAGASGPSTEPSMNSSSSSSDTSLTSPQHHQNTRRKIAGHKPSSPITSGRPVRRGNDTAARKEDGARGQHDSVPTRMTQSRGYLQSAKSQDNTLASSSASRGSRRAGQGSAVPEDPLDGSDGLLSNANSTHISLGDVAHSQGKLPKVSQATKQRASQQLPEQSDIFEMPVEHNKKPRTRNEVGKGASASTQPTTRMPKPTAVTNTERANQGRQTRSKGKADTDNDFVPNRPTAGNRGTKRKDPMTAAESAGRPSKKPRSKARLPTEGDPENETGLPQLQPVEANKSVTSRRMDKSSKTQESREPPSSILSTRTPLIGGLLGVQQPSQAPKAAFRKPPLPPRSPPPPSTPSQRHSRPRPTTTRPRTPKLRGVVQDSAMPAIQSSPPPTGVTETESMSALHGITETEILSSNSKPVPASPHAESMAISGHADRDDIDLEKVEADIQMARLNPFARARDNSKSTSFVRRLTGDDLYIDRAELVEGSSQKLPNNLDESPSSDEEGLVHKGPSQSVLRTRSTESDKSPSKTPIALSQMCAIVTGNCKAHSNGPGKGDASSAAKQATREDSDHTSTAQQLREAPVVDDSTGKESRELARPLSDNDEPKPAADMVNSTLATRQDSVEDTQRADLVEPRDGSAVEGDVTLVNDDSEELPADGKASHLRLRTAPPSSDAPSSHSSTSAESESSSQPPVPTSEAEEMEWEASLQPHQRALHDLLIKVSNRVLRHIVDNETAAADIAGDFANDSQHLLHKVLKRHNEAYAEVREDLETKRTTLRKELQKSAKSLARERKRVSAVV
ncbi:hypothetical protein FB567DRAFT_534796 [Paraphoma chrysanthemicola]|uniref:Uncharacterized protein n=1 Tax=Paraphoma chrysanthemicola TaxID=798071 RepID=A0A8K0VUH3_9PLEO|nr:hypothetical protein FB567DRAFT_534796 [Paraphoma chrysanthemicola]